LPPVSSIPNKDHVLLLWKHLLALNSLPINDHYDSHSPTSLQLAKGVSSLSWNDILDKYHSLPNASVQKLLLGMYCLIPPVRADFYALHISPNNSSSFPNFIFISPHNISLTIRDFKTASKYGSIHHPSLPTELQDQIRLFLKENPERSFLFSHSDNLPFTRHSFTVWANRCFANIFQINITISVLRHLFISSLPSLSPSQKSSLSSLMGHSISMQRSYRWK